jgi:glycosyltransferase involved in cell wall biosynthesis
MKASIRDARSGEKGSVTSSLRSSFRSPGRLSKSRPFRVLAPEFRVGFVIGRRVNLVRSEIPHFRALNVIAALETIGLCGIWCYEPEIPDRIEQLLSCDILVLVRGAMSQHLQWVIESAARAGIPVVFDIDDYCFTRQSPEHLAAARRYSANEIEDYNNAADRYLETLFRCGYFTSSTTPLAGHGEKFGLKSYVLRNTLNHLWLKVTEEIVAQRTHRRTDKEVTIGYFPGSCTHQRDFRQALPAILKVLDTYGEVRLLLGELLDLTDFPELRSFLSRVEIIPRVPWQELAYEIARVDINIAPLELDEFCQSKSELKYFQAGALAIPTIVTPTTPYLEVIEHGVNGFLASDQTDWYEQLGELITDEGLRKEVGWKARERVLKSYTPANLLDQAIAAYGHILQDYCAPDSQPVTDYAEMREGR